MSFVKSFSFTSDNQIYLFKFGLRIVARMLESGDRRVFLGEDGEAATIGSDFFLGEKSVGS